MPEFVISLEASDDFIKARVMNLPESTTAGTKISEEGIVYASFPTLRCRSSSMEPSSDRSACRVSISEYRGGHCAKLF